MRGNFEIPYNKLYPPSSHPPPPAITDSADRQGGRKEVGVTLKFHTINYLKLLSPLSLRALAKQSPFSFSQFDFSPKMCYNTELERCKKVLYFLEWKRRKEGRWKDLQA